MVILALIGLAVAFHGEIDWTAVGGVSTALALVGTAITIVFTERKHRADRIAADADRQRRRDEAEQRRREERDAADAAALRVDLQRVESLSSRLVTLAAQITVPYDAARDVVEALEKRLPGDATIAEIVERLTDGADPLRAFVVMDAAATCDSLRQMERLMGELQSADVALRGSCRLVSTQVLSLIASARRHHASIGLFDVFKSPPRGSAKALLERVGQIPLSAGASPLEELVATWAAAPAHYHSPTVRAIGTFITGASVVLIELPDADLAAVSRLQNPAATASKDYLTDLRLHLEGIRHLLPTDAHATLASLAERLERTTAPKPRALDRQLNGRIARDLRTFPGATRGTQLLRVLTGLAPAAREDVVRLARDERDCRIPDSETAPGLYLGGRNAAQLARAGLTVACWPPRIDADGDRFFALTNLGRQVARLILATEERPGYLDHVVVAGREDNGTPPRDDVDAAATLALLRAAPPEEEASASLAVLRSLSPDAVRCLGYLVVEEIAHLAPESMQVPRVGCPAEAAHELVGQGLCREVEPRWLDEDGDPFLLLTGQGRRVGRLISFEEPRPPHLAGVSIPGRADDVDPPRVATPAAQEDGDAAVLSRLMTPPAPREGELLIGVIAGFEETAQAALVEYVKDELACRQPGSAHRPGLPGAPEGLAALVDAGLVSQVDAGLDGRSPVHALTPLGREVARLVVAAATTGA